MDFITLFGDDNRSLHKTLIMNFQKKLFLSCFFGLLVLFQKSKAQGCSDAGFCTLNSFKPSDSAVLWNGIKLGLSYGQADHGITILSQYLEYTRQINNKLSIDAKLTAISQSSPILSVYSLSDLFITGNYAVNHRLKSTLGLKIPLNDANKKMDGLPLPMDFQSSLGTFDIIAGINYEIRKLQLALAIQQPLTQNKNQFIAQEYPSNSDLMKFQTTNSFKRAGDVLLRVTYPFRVANKLKITPGLLPIYHLSNDKYTDMSGLEHEIKGSSGLTLNGTVYFDYQINAANGFQFNFGMPFVVREARPDGLTRHYIASLEYSRRF
jgi:hypothetical protein